MRKCPSQFTSLVGRCDIQEVPRLAVEVVALESISLVFYYLTEDIHQVGLNCWVYDKWCIVANKYLRFIYSDKIGNHIICFVPYRNKTPFTLYSQELRFIIIQSIDVLNLLKTIPSLRPALINCITRLVSDAQVYLIYVVLGHLVIELDSRLAANNLQLDLLLVH